MYRLYEMDERYILKSIQKSDIISDYFKQHLVNCIICKNRLTLKEIDIITFLIGCNNELSHSYKEMLINIIKEG